MDKSEKLMKDFPHLTQEEAEAIVKKEEQRSRKDIVSKTLEEATASEKLGSGIRDIKDGVKQGVKHGAKSTVGRALSFLNEAVNGEKGTSAESDSSQPEQAKA